MVQLEPSGVALFKELDGSFNSIMVQLERALVIVYLLTSCFQFHYGSIRTFACGEYGDTFDLSIPLWFN